VTVLIEGNSAAVAGLVTHHGRDLPAAAEAPAHLIAVHPLHLTLTRALHYPLHPSSLFFNRARAQKVHQSAPSASDGKCTTYSNVNPTPAGMEQRPDAAKTTKGGLSRQPETSSATTGILGADARQMVTTTVTSAQDVETRITALSTALELRKSQALTPYNASEWNLLLRECDLLTKYPNLPNSLCYGFDAGIQRINETATPGNSPTLHIHSEAYQQIVDKEFERGRYIGPCSRNEVEALIGPFQSSPLSLVPKPGKPGKFRAVHNFSYPRIPSLRLSSINYTIDSNMYPCTWGTFSTICYTIHNLPPGSQASIRDVAEAYRTIPITYTQWPGLVVKLRDENSFAINTCNNFGLTSAGGIYGELGDATVDIFRRRGIGPLSKWVDDHIFFRIRCEYIPSYNARRREWCKTIAKNGGRIQSGSRYWYQGETMPNDLPAEFDEDAASSIKDYSATSIRSANDAFFTYCDADIDALSEKLGIPWEASKTIPFNDSVPYLGFDWNLSLRTVSITPAKRAKYKAAVEEWLSKSAHTLDEVQKLYGKLLHICLVIPAGRAYLTNLEAMLGTFSSNPFVPHHAPRDTTKDLSWWLNILTHTEISRCIPGPCVVTDRGAFSDASSGIGIGIIIAGRWRAWRLIPGWKGKGRDIGWAEAVGFEFLVRTLITVSAPGEHFKVFGDNRGVVEGWWKGRSRNKETNHVFRRIHNLSTVHQCTFITRYVPSKANPADEPSRGIYASTSLLLPAIHIPEDLRQFVIDYDCKPLPCERDLTARGNTLKPLPKPERDFNHHDSEVEFNPIDNSEWF